MNTNLRLIGFDEMLNEFMHSFGSNWTENYPPRNLVKIDDNHFLLELAVAGFSTDELKVTTEEDTLTVYGVKKAKANTTQYLIKGIAERDFTLSYKLMDYIKVTDCKYTDGILQISLERVVPTAKKLKEFKITQ